MARRILVLGATGMLGQSVTRSLAKMGNKVRVLVRNREKARQMFGNEIEIVEGNALFGAPSITLDEWFRMQKPTVKI